MPDTIASDYPKSVTLPDGAKVEIRLMTATDRDEILAFAQALPEEDLLFLRVDLTQPDVVDTWITNMESGLSTSLVVYDDKSLIGLGRRPRHRQTDERPGQ